MHADYINIPVGYNVFRFECDLLPRSKPLDCVFTMGYKDLVRGHSSPFMMDCQLFAQAVLDHGKEQHPDAPNNISIATLMYPQADMGALALPYHFALCIEHVLALTC